MADFKYSAGVDINLNVKGMNNQLKDLQKQLQQISNMKIDIGTGNLTADIEKASEAAMKLSAHLATATNPQTGNLDFTKFYTSIQKSGASLQEYGQALQNMGPAGQKAFVSLADSISKAEIPLKRTSKLVDGMWDNLKKTIGWQMSSSLVHGFIGSMQQAVGYAKDLNNSLTDIRIVTGASTDQMAQFAKQANQAAKNLSTTTTDYTKASLIYYQQGLSDQEVKARTETTIKMANATGTSAQKVSDQMTAIWNNYDNGTKSLTHYADVMTALGAATASSTDEIAEGLQKFASISDTVGLSYEYAASALATITSTSRESADVVGNSLKTLFSRIQGLQLGETLDDGTTLNKYSTALAKVGISIKDSSGELKDMDLILDEMGTKWQTLASDEKMALAQTVAGVRQYTQLMTLMENWDEFKQNVNIANTSGGTLDAQAAIYAESWEAASQRVRASWEGLWDNLINSDSAISVLDTMSSFVDVLNTITTGLGGAGGALSHFAGIFLKLFTPQIGQTLNNIGYGFNMMFGGRERMVQAKSTWLTNAKNILGADSAMFDIGAYEGEARQNVYQDRFDRSLRYAENQDKMSPEERLLAQRRQMIAEEMGDSYIRAGQQYDASKNALFEAYWDMSDEKGNLLDRTKKDIPELTEQVRKELQKQISDSEQRVKNAEASGKGQQYIDDEKRAHQKRTAWAQAQLNTPGLYKSKADFEKGIQDADYIQYGQRMRDQAAAMVDFQDTLTSLGNTDVTDAMGAFKTSWESLDTTLRSSSGGLKFFETMKNAITQAQMTGDWSEVKGHAASSSKFLNDTFSKILADEFNLNLDEEQQAKLSTYMNQAYQVELDKRKYENYQNALKNQQEAEKKEKIKNPANWGEGLASAAEGTIAALSLVQQLKALGQEGITAGEALSAAATGLGSLGMSVSGFAQALQVTGLAAGKAAGIWGVALTGVVMALQYGAEKITEWYNQDAIQAANSAKAVSLSQNAAQEAEAYSASLTNQIEAYKEANDAIQSFTFGSTERSEAILEANRQASNLIAENKLEEGKDYSRVGDQIKINDNVLDNLQQQAEDTASQADYAADMAAVTGQQSINKSNATELRRQMMDSVGVGTKDAGWAIAELIGGAVLAGAGAFFAPVTGGASAAAGVPMGAYLMGKGANTLTNQKNYSDDLKTAMDYITENGTSILNGTAIEIADQLSIDPSVASVLLRHKNQLDNYADAIDQQAQSEKLVVENTARNIIAQNETVQRSKHAIEIADSAGKVYQQEYNKIKNEVESVMSDDAMLRSKAQEYAELMGYSDNMSFQLGNIDRDKKTISYSYFDQESGTTVSKEMAFDQITSGLATSGAEKYLDGEWVEGALKVANELNTTTGGKGLLALVTGGDFGKTSINQIKKFQENIDKINPETIQRVGEQFGYTEDELNNLINKSKAFNVDVFNDLLNKNGFANSSLGQSDYEDWMSMENLQSLTREMLPLGNEAGKQFADGLFNMLNESGLDKDQWSNALNMLLNNVDWGSWDALAQARSIIESMGGSLDTGTVTWQNFANAMRDAQGSIPDFSSLIDQLSQILSLLNSLKAGDTIDESDFASLLDAVGGKDSKYADMFKVNENGEREFIGTQEDADDLRNAYIAESERSLATARQTIADINSARENIKGSDLEVAQNLSDGEVTWDDVRKGTYSTVTGDWVQAMTGMSAQEIFALSIAENKANSELNGANSELNAANAALTDAKVAYLNASTEFTQNTDLDGDGAVSTAEQVNALETEVRNAEIAVSEAQARVDAAQVQADLIAGQQNEIASKVDSIMENGVEDMTGEQIEQLVSAKYDTYSRLEEGKLSGDSLIVDDKGNYTDAGIKQLKDLANTWEGGADAVNAYNGALERRNELEAANRDQDKTNDPTAEDIEAADKALEAAEANMELAAAIAEVAEARGLDAEAVNDMAQYIQELHSDDDEWKEWAKQNADAIAEMSAEMVEASAASEDIKKGFAEWKKALDSKDIGASSKAFRELTNNLFKLIKAEDTLSGKTKKLGQYMENYLKKNMDKVKKAAEGNEEAYEDLQDVMAIDSVLRNTNSSTEQATEAVSSLRSAMKALGDDALQVGDVVAEGFNVGANGVATGIASMNSGFESLQGGFNNLLSLCQGNIPAFQDAIGQMGYRINWIPVDATSTNAPPDGTVWTLEKEDGYVVSATPHTVSAATQDATSQYYTPQIVFEGGNTAGGGGSGGGGGGGEKEPKKVANKRKSQTVKRYKRNDAKRSSAEKSKKSAENQKDYLYGESKIAQMEKINKLAEKEAKITADRIRESRKYLVEDRENLIKYMQKYGFEAEFDADGFLANYEEAWSAVYEEIAALYKDNLLTEDEEKIEEALNVKLEELEGALEDYENSLSELADDIEAYEESLYERYDNKVEALQHKVEFKIELEEDDLEYLDFWIETLGDNIYNSIEAIEAMGEKANMLFNGLDVYKQGVQDIYDLSNDPLQVWATGGLEEVLTQDQVDTLRENRDGLMDYMQQLIDLREEIKDKVLDTFDSWQEKIDATAASLQHYTSVIEHFKNIIDIVGKDPFGLSDEFMNRLEQNTINQSMDNIEANKAYYESLTEQQQKAEEELANARQRGDESSIEHWEEVVRTTTEAVQSAQDTLLTSLEDTLTMIAEQFETAMQRAVDAFNDAIYSYGGMEGLVNDYNLIRENADLMAADYEKIYELSKLTRDINKVLDDTNIVAGKKKMNGLLKEINELQADGVELSKYDLEYLRAKYELRLAEIELENAQNSKDTVRLSKDSEGNWSYVYTQNADAAEEAEQKYEDALYEMQNLSQEYLEEMSSMMLNTSQSMMEEISALRIQDFTSYEAYQTEIKRIQDKYAQSLKFQEDELNKSIQNSSDLYEQDWQAYNQVTGYKISLAENWVDSFREATLGDILDIDTFMSGFSDTFLSLTDEMSAQLADAAIQYFDNVDTAMKTYGTSINQFGVTTTTTIDNISQKSKTAKDDLKVMASEMSDAFKEIADYVSDWQEEFSGQIDTMLEEIKTLIQSINEAIRKSAELTEGQSGAGELIGSAEAIELLNATGLFGSWSKNGSVGIKVDGKDTNFVDYNAALIEEIDDAVARYTNAKTGTDERERLGEELKELFKRYWQFRDIVNRVYDPTNLTTNMDAPTFTSFDTGGYTGEWGQEGRMAMLHEKELILNANDTSNFLDALNISKEIINSMIEMNARASSLGFGELSPSNIPEWNQTLEQTVTITAEFPDATDHNEIEEAFTNLLNTASQYANRNRD